MAISPTKKSIESLKHQGFLVAITEHFNFFAKRRMDLFGFIDLLALKENELLAVQTTTLENLGTRLAKIKGTPAAVLWLMSPSRRLQIHGWKKGKGKGYPWELTTREVHLTDVIDHTMRD